MPKDRSRPQKELHAQRTRNFRPFHQDLPAAPGSYPMAAANIQLRNEVILSLDWLMIPIISPDWLIIPRVRPGLLIIPIMGSRLSKLLRI